MRRKRSLTASLDLPTALKTAADVLSASDQEGVTLHESGEELKPLKKLAREIGIPLAALERIVRPLAWVRYDARPLPWLYSVKDVLKAVEPYQRLDREREEAHARALASIKKARTHAEKLSRDGETVASVRVAIAAILSEGKLDAISFAQAMDAIVADISMSGPSGAP